MTSTYPIPFRIFLWTLASALGLGACVPISPSSSAATVPAVDATARPADRDYWACTTGQVECRDDIVDWLDRIEVPLGFAVSHVAQLPAEAAPTAITYGPDGRLYAATIPRPFEEDFSGTIYVLGDDNTFVPYATGFLLPVGLVFKPNSAELYVSSRAGRFEGKVSVVDSDGGIQDIVTGLPCCYTGMEHQPNGLAFGPDGLLYLAIGARTDHGEALWGNPPGFLDPLEAGILRMQPDGDKIEVFAQGLRNPYGLDFDLLGQLWTDDNGPDFGLSDRLIQVQERAHYGFPYYGQDSCADCLSAPADLVISPPYVEFPAHATPAGLTAYKGEQFPANYLNSVFIALWNPGPGGKVIRVHGNHQADDFVTGVWAPVDVTNAPDGSLVVADYLSGRLFKITWSGLP